MARARPSSTNSISVFQVETKSPSYSVGSGQWMRNRSIESVRSLRRVSSNARRASSGRWKPLFSFEVRKTSDRMPSTASPTPASFWYISAVSMWR